MRSRRSAQRQRTTPSVLGSGPSSTHAARSANQRHAASSHVCDCLGIPPRSQLLGRLVSCRSPGHNGVHPEPDRFHSSRISVLNFCKSGRYSADSRRPSERPSWAVSCNCRRFSKPTYSNTRSTPRTTCTACNPRCSRPGRHNGTDPLNGGPVSSRRKLDGRDAGIVAGNDLW